MLKRTLLMSILCCFHLGFRVDDGESLLADGYPHNIREIGLRRLLRRKLQRQMRKLFLAVVVTICFPQLCSQCAMVTEGVRDRARASDKQATHSIKWTVDSEIKPRLCRARCSSYLHFKECTAERRPAANHLQKRHLRFFDSQTGLFVVIGGNTLKIKNIYQHISHSVIQHSCLGEVFALLLMRLMIFQRPHSLRAIFSQN